MLKYPYPKVDLTRWCVPVLRASFRESMNDDSIEFRVVATVRNVDGTGCMDHVMSVTRMHRCVKPEQIAEMIRNALYRMVCHEIDECVFIDGLRVTDPHPEIAREQQAREMAGLK